MSKLELFKQWWRPAGVSMFIIGIFFRYMGVLDHNLPEAVELKILEIMKWFIGLYAAGRSGEKIAALLKPDTKDE
jgi:hypothetical protein